MHILIIPSWFPKSSEDVSGVFFRDQAEALADAGNMVGVIAQYPVSLLSFFYKKNNQVFQRRCEIKNLKIYRRKFLAFLPKVPCGVFLLWFIAAKRQFEKYIAKHGKPDVIHAHSAVYAGLIAVIIGRIYKIPVVITEHSSAFALNLYSGWELHLARYALRKADERIAVSRRLAVTLRELIQDPALHIKVIPNVVSKRFFDTPVREYASPSSLRILSVGSLDTNKNQANLMRAYTRIVNEIADAELWIVGDGPERRNLEILAGELLKRGQVRLFGGLPPKNLPSVMSSANVVVISSNYETFGLVAAEALVLGKPVVSTRCGGPEDIVADYDGLLVPTDSHEKLAAAILHIYRNPCEFDSTGISKRAKIRFSGAMISSVLTGSYMEVLENAKR